jgi:predicted nucleotidyltransferase
MTVIDDLAADVGVSVPTIRRAVEIGLIRGTRPSPRKLEVPLAERVYVRRNWPLLSDLRRHLRTEKSVRVAVLFGSTARGSAGEDSDIDLAVLLDGDAPSARLALQARLAEKLGRRVQVTDMRDARASSPLWNGIREDGRVLANRDDVDWLRIRARRS